MFILLDEYENTLTYLLDNNSKTRHATLIDPEKQTPEEAAKIIQIAIEAGTELILIGGSTTNQNSLQKTVETIQEIMELQQWAKTQNNFLHTPSQIIPVILFPNASTTIKEMIYLLKVSELLNL